MASYFLNMKLHLFWRKFDIRHTWVRIYIWYVETYVETYSKSLFFVC